jgi:hypothetical protein
MLEEKCHQFLLDSLQKFLAEFTRIHSQLVVNSKLHPIPFRVVLQFLHSFPVKNPFLRVFQTFLKKNLPEEISTVNLDDFAHILNACTSMIKEKIIQEYNGNYENFEIALYQYLLA